MRKTSVNLYYTSEIDTKQKIDLIKTLYDEIFIGIYDKKETMTYEEQVKYLKEINLPCSMVHCSYYEPELDNFWLDNQIGEKVLNSYLSQIPKCVGVSDNFVVHLNGSKNSVVSKIGLKRIEKLLAECEKYNINLCIENLYSDKEIPYIFENIKHKNLKICFDVGHKNFLTPDFDMFKNYGKYIQVLHIHDNDGISDLHKNIFTGTINWEEFAKSVAKFPLTLCMELKHKGESDINTYLQENIKSIEKLQKMIEKYESK